MHKLFLLFLFASCSSVNAVQMQDRTYDLCVNKDSKPTCDGYCYQDEVCVKKVLGICLKKEIQVVDKLAMNIPQPLCQSLFDLNFIMQTRKKPF